MLVISTNITSTSQENLMTIFIDSLDSEGLDIFNLGLKFFLKPKSALTKNLKKQFFYEY